MKYKYRLFWFFVLIMIEIFLIFNVLYIKGPLIHIDNKIINISYGSNYIVEKPKVSYLGKDLAKDLMIDSNINLKKVGNYRVIYSVFINSKEYKKNKYVNVIDNSNPKIELTNELISYACPNKEYIEEGYVITDNLDNDLNTKVKIKKYDKYWLYVVTDTSGNITLKKRNIIYEDHTSPIITLNSSNMNMYINSEYNEPGFTVSDNNFNYYYY